MMEPAEQHAVVGMGRTAPGMLLHMMDLAPLRRNVAPRDHATAVTESDCAPLVMVEDSIERLDRHDPAQAPYTTR